MWALQASMSFGSTPGGKGWTIALKISTPMTKAKATARAATTLPMLRRSERNMIKLRLVLASHFRAFALSRFHDSIPRGSRKHERAIQGPPSGRDLLFRGDLNQVAPRVAENGRGDGSHLDGRLGEHDARRPQP